MTKHFLILVFLFFQAFVLAQKTDRDPNGPLQDISFDWNSRMRYPTTRCDTLYYTVDIDPVLIDSAIAKLRQNMIYKSDWTQQYPDPLKLTSAERNDLIAGLESFKLLKWPDGMFAKSKAISRSDIAKSLAVTEQMPTEQQKYMCSIVYTFSKPLFFRDGKYCLSLSQYYYRTNYTQLHFSFYVRRGDFWEVFAPLYGYYESQKEN